MSALDGFDPDQHILLEAKTDYLLDRAGAETYLRTRQGFSARVPRDLGGISGCSVWMIGDLRQSIHDWNPREARIVALETAVYPERGVIRATRWAAVSTVIYQAYPDLREALEIYRPITLLGWK